MFKRKHSSPESFRFNSGWANSRPLFSCSLRQDFAAFWDRFVSRRNFLRLLCWAPGFGPDVASSNCAKSTSAHLKSPVNPQKPLKSTQKYFLNIHLDDKKATTIKLPFPVTFDASPGRRRSRPVRFSIDTQAVIRLSFGITERFISSSRAFAFQSRASSETLKMNPNPNRTINI